jgi:hypothetical protein
MKIREQMMPRLATPRAVTKPLRQVRGVTRPRRLASSAGQAKAAIRTGLTTHSVVRGRDKVQSKTQSAIAMVIGRLARVKTRIILKAPIQALDMAVGKTRSRISRFIRVRRELARE